MIGTHLLKVARSRETVKSALGGVIAVTVNAWSSSLRLSARCGWDPDIVVQRIQRFAIRTHDGRIGSFLRGQSDWPDNRKGDDRIAVCKPFAMMVGSFAINVGLTAFLFSMTVSPNRPLFASRGD